MNLELTETQTLIRETARKFARERVAPLARELDRQERFPTEIFKELGELGLLGVNIPAKYGGSEAGAVSYALAMMEMAAADASTSVAMAVTNMCAELINAFGTEAQREKYVTRLTSGEAVAGSFALSEPHAGSDPGALLTSAVRRGDSWVINGSKQWITSGAHAGVMVVWARTSATGNKGLSCFIVEGGTQGLIIGRHEDKMGLRSSNTVALTFEDCVIPAENLLGSEGQGFRLAMVALDGGRIGIASQACGVARAALEASVSYVKDRKAFGQAIGEFQGPRFMIADMKTQIDAAELLTLRAAYMKDQKQPFTREASMAKLFASETSNRVCDKAVQLHGGYGYIDEFPVERYFRDARVQTIYEGTSEVQRMVIARESFKLLG
ncbi:acyl-CoA dehydrogenase family protein [Myxococcus sp. CA051A]|uniref:Cyclohex-1-ene-1-carbonyl-CoA dehydrogenase n=1 Tax=Myxococcus llanfairpwllgwyngyllgogerychwyrndrobwllllantysiliogogogochensis TaxID=2590453 RepID=A0A540WY13_9BACT|nr:acyl-CoA dehydrogenase family protein [Myxococcus llanfairpwllgwyngyllgogerychwyrndrobwllllantysiliogogogochensis]NTX06609.1 acyl-CoA dehydrogenase family protein [Myxococcus sp. CA040A]NTX16913.1 acyl-CoA dehydrogenase family protein [Myxococcus sp. CA056]NTX36695.1 acyl-CoA dehydrogenase family protein [Myxococcus sp. CA033]NTX53294.1 acyl-CoA dehydrogenase family protein [Myxococcus sp. CA039A]NTX67298.1 acyl-CoA dehydrogenase family protein [Myxococcus sp. CA051A]